LTNEKAELKPIELNVLFGARVMKVHKYQFEVMWLVLAVLGCWAASGNVIELPHQPRRQDGFQKKTHSPIQIRPPPLFG
jgi:hypothetical protein